jgi:NADH-quinone oxidoreductase subunit A
MPTKMMAQGSLIAVFGLTALLIAGVVVVVAAVLGPRATYSEKASAYECGFEPFGDARDTFDVHFYLVAIMFIIFDIEIAFLFPWAQRSWTATFASRGVALLFLFILAVGLAFEWRLGLLRWKTAAIAQTYSPTK